MGLLEPRGGTGTGLPEPRGHGDRIAGTWGTWGHGDMGRECRSLGDMGVRMIEPKGCRDLGWGCRSLGDMGTWGQG